jgi:hypothetical protein
MLVPTLCNVKKKQNYSLDCGKTNPVEHVVPKSLQFVKKKQRVLEATFYSVGRLIQ